MSGFDRNRFISLEDDVYEEIKCGVCLGVLNKPLVSHCCQQSYCCECINEWLKNSKTCPNCRKNMTKNKLNSAPRFCINLIERHDIHCDYQKDGCNQVLKLGLLPQHVNVCPFNPKNKCQFCGESCGVEHNCNERLVDTVNALKLEIESLKKNYNKLKSRLRTNKTKNCEQQKRFEDQLKAESDENKRLAENVSQLESEKDVLVQQMETLREEKTDFDQQLKGFFTENEKFKNEIKDLRNKCEKLLNERDVMLKNNENLVQEIESVKQQNQLISEQNSNYLIELNKYKVENEELRKHQTLNEQHMTEVIKSGRDNSNKFEIIRSKLSKIRQPIAVQKMQESINKFDSFKQIADHLKAEIEGLRKGIFWTTIVYSESCGHCFNYSNEDIIDVRFGLLRIKLISA